MGSPVQATTVFVVLYGSKKKAYKSISTVPGESLQYRGKWLEIDLLIDFRWEVLLLLQACSSFEHWPAQSLHFWAQLRPSSYYTHTMIEFTLSFTQCVVLCALALPPLWPWCNQLKSAWCWWKCSSKTSWLCTPSSNLPQSVLVHSVYLCYKTIPLRRPVPRPPTHPTTLNAPTYVTWLQSLFRDQSLNFPIVYSTTHKASLLQD